MCFKLISNTENVNFCLKLHGHSATGCQHIHYKALSRHVACIFPRFLNFSNTSGGVTSKN